MPPKRGAGSKRKSANGTGGRKSKSPVPGPSSTTKKRSTTPTNTALPSAGFLLTCDPPTKQFIKRLDDLKSKEKKFIIEDLDTTHLLIKEKAKDEIFRKVEDWMNEVSALPFFFDNLGYDINHFYSSFSILLIRMFGQMSNQRLK